MRTRRRHRGLWTLGVLASALTLTACTSDSGGQGYYTFTSATEAGHVIAPGSRSEIRDYRGVLLSGGHLDVRSLRGKIVVLNFWAEWCDPCKAETPQFDLLARAVRHRGIDFVGLDYKDDPGKAQAFVTENHISYPSLEDEEGEAELRFGNVPAQGPPFTILLDRNQRVAAVYLGRQSDADLRHAFAALQREH